MSTRFRTKRPRAWEPDACAVCGDTGDRGRCDAVGTFLCSSHGMKARRHCEKALFRHEPQLAHLLFTNPSLSWLKAFLRADLMAKTIKYPTTDVPLSATLPYPYMPMKSRHEVDERDDCTVCGEVFEARADVRRHAGVELCRTCCARNRRATKRANDQFYAIVRIVRALQQPWLLRCLDAKLADRCVKYISKGRRPQHDKSDFI